MAARCLAPEEPRAENGSLFPIQCNGVWANTVRPQCRTPFARNSESVVPEKISIWTYQKNKEQARDIQPV